MKLELSTELLNIVDCGLYNTCLGEINIKEEKREEFEILICDNATSIIYDIMAELELKVEIQNSEFWSPTYYNYSNNCVNFDLIIDEVEIAYLFNKCLNDFKFWDFIHNRYINCSGYISFMPSSRYEFIQAIQGKDLDRAFAACINYIVEKKGLCYDLQSEFEMDVQDTCYCNGWIDESVEYEVYFDYFREVVTMPYETDDIQSVIDTLIDTLEENGEMIHFVNPNEYDDDSYVIGGNHCLALYHGGNFRIELV